MSEVRKIKLSEFVERKRTEGALDVELSNGKTARIDPPDLWSENARVIILDPDKDDTDLGKELMGAANWKQFVADGGTAALFASLLHERYDLSKGESSASSSS